jgi:hypothetical protein
MQITDELCEHTEYAFADSEDYSDTFQHHLEPITNPDFDEISRNLGEPVDDEPTMPELAGEALISMLSWIVGSHPNSEASYPHVAARAMALCLLLRPELVDGIETMQDIACLCGCSRAALSKSILELRDVTGFSHCRHIKSESSRETYAKSAKAGWKTRIARIREKQAKA